MISQCKFPVCSDQELFVMDVSKNKKVFWDKEKKNSVKKRSQR